MTNSISCSFFVAPSRYKLFIDAVKSLKNCNSFPGQISAYFNPAQDSKELDETLIFCEGNNIDVFKFYSFNSLSKVWNHSIRESKSPYHLICNDDILFDNPDSIDLILSEHKKGRHFVKGGEAFSAFSLSKRLVDTVGYFDENFVWSWEDADYRLRMSKIGVQPYEILPNPIRHLRCSSGRNDEYWNKSSEYFFEKWNISKLLVDLGVTNAEIKATADDRKYLLLNGFFGENFYTKLHNKVELK